VDLLCFGFHLHGLRDLGPLYRIWAVCAFFSHGMAGIDICTNVACNSNCVRRIRDNADTPGMGAPLTAFSFQLLAADNCDSLVSACINGGSNAKSRMKADLEDSSMAYLAPAIMAIAVIAVVLVVRLLQVPEVSHKWPWGKAGSSKSSQDWLSR
jgi:hypothetical protein